MSAGVYARLLYWLGPWADDTAAPQNIERRAITVDGDRPFEAWVYRPSPRSSGPGIRGAYLLTPGLHPDGPSDPRLDRFARVLAASGQLVLAPFLPDYTALVVQPTVIGDLERAFDALMVLDDRPLGVKPGVFSISFGSLPALRLAASERYRNEVGALLVFGGYADFHDAIRFSLGEDTTMRDPLNRPVVFLNLLDRIEDVPTDPGPLVACWMRFINATWGRPEMKAPERYRPIAERIAADLEGRSRELFLIGCGVQPGAKEACAPALQSGLPGRDYLDPRPYMEDIRCPVHLVHGADDDVIPAAHMDLLKAAMPDDARVSTHLTGLYGHTGRNLVALSRLAAEGWTLLHILSALVRGGSRR